MVPVEVGVWGNGRRTGYVCGGLVVEVGGGRGDGVALAVGRENTSFLSSPAVEREGEAVGRTARRDVPMTKTRNPPSRTADGGTAGRLAVRPPHVPSLAASVPSSLALPRVGLGDGGEEVVEAGPRTVAGTQGGREGVERRAAR